MKNLAVSSQVYVMIKTRHIIYSVFTIAMVALLSGCKMLVLDPKGSIAADEKTLLITALILLLIIVVPVIVLTFIIAYKYRASNKEAKYTPDWCHNNKLEAAWWIAPIIICGILGVIIWISTHKLDPYKPLVSTVKPVEVQVVSLQWRWLFIYPQEGIATINYLKLPVDTPINFSLTADSPMNSFQIPQLGGQIYTMSGMKTQLHLIANHTGTYSGRSVSFSGKGFLRMIFNTHVTSKADFDKWTKEMKERRGKLTLETYKKLVEPNTDDSIMYYSSVRKGLFNTIMMQYMNPETYKLLNGHSTSKHIQYK